MEWGYLKIMRQLLCYPLSCYDCTLPKHCKIVSQVNTSLFKLYETFVVCEFVPFNPQKLNVF